MPEKENKVEVGQKRKAPKVEFKPPEEPPSPSPVHTISTINCT